MEGLRLDSLGAGPVGSALGAGVAVDKLDDRHRSHVAIPEAGLQDPDIAALTVLVARPEDREQAFGVHVLLQRRMGLTAGMQIAALGQRDQLFDDRAQFLGFRQGGLDLFVFCLLYTSDAADE